MGLINEMAEILKFSALVSIPVFASIFFAVYFQVKRSKQISEYERSNKPYSLGQNTISQLVFYIDDWKFLNFYKLNFVLKGIFDLIFAVYVYTTLQFEYSILFLILATLSALSFASIGHFTEKDFYKKHFLVTYLSGGTWLIAQLLLVFNAVPSLLITAIIIFSLVTITTIVSAKTDKTNAFVQGFCVVLMGIWTYFIVITAL